MRFFHYSQNGVAGLAISNNGVAKGLLETDTKYPGAIFSLIEAGGDAFANAADVLENGDTIDLDAVTYLPPITEASKFICVGLNYRAHTAEGPYEQPDYPTLFARFSSSLVAHDQPILRPKASEQLDFEGELVAIVGKTAKDVEVEDAMDYVVGYSLFNDGSVRDFQRITPQWTAGKNFDGTGAFGPEFVTADELPVGCKGLTLQTRLNGEVVQKAPIDDMVFPIDQLISICSKFMTLYPGDVIVSGTPSGVGHARTPQLWMKEGDVVEVEVDKVGILRNPIKNA